MIFNRLILDSASSGSSSSSRWATTGSSKALLFVLAFVAVVFFVIIVYLAYFSVKLRSYEAAIVERKGVYKRTATRSFSLLFPFLDKVVAKLDLRPKTSTITKPFLLTDKKGALFCVSMTFVYRISDPQAFFYKCSCSDEILQVKVAPLLRSFFLGEIVESYASLLAMDGSEFVQMANPILSEAVGAELVSMSFYRDESAN